eukprot:scaffold24618_cov127-Cylindrotheca_fusiformis.AAC.10
MDSNEKSGMRAPVGAQRILLLPFQKGKERCTWMSVVSFPPPIQLPRRFAVLLCESVLFAIA